LEIQSNPERSNSAQLSTSSGTDVEVGVISFDQALCSTMEGGESSKKLWWKKSSIVDADRVISIMTTIPREIGLDAQNFHCPMCRKLIGAEFSNYGICGIDGLYYCSDCMNAGGEVVIPSRILRSWDWRPRPVSDRGRAFFEANQVPRLILRVYFLHTSLKSYFCLREKLQIASMYLFNCRESIAEDFRKRVWPRNHLYSDVHAYSVSDMILLRSGLLEKQITGFLAHAIDHIMHCFLCRQKGFVCEVCEARGVIYPFQTETTYKPKHIYCSHCSSVFHATCVNRAEDCPKCIRRAKYEIQQERVICHHATSLVAGRWWILVLVYP
uniref:DUF4206 domain-containing protein n=1 Tax=Angiostrongylus cantonensis TaxID=6313 RepID=A0A0K0CYY1_ANGCA